MPTFAVMAITPGERAKADSDPSYAPKEYKVLEVWANDYKSACRKVRDLIDRGYLPDSAEVIESEED